MPRRASSPPSSGELIGRYSDSGVLVLASLVSGPKHGYGLIKDIEQFSGVKIAIGTLYGTLERLADRGLIERLPAEDRRNPYAITSLGRHSLSTYFTGLAQVTAELGLRLRAAGI